MSARLDGRMRVASPDGAARTPRSVCLSHRATQVLCGAHLRAHGGRGGERGGRDAVSGDWWFLAAATPLSLVSPPATSSRQHVLASARPATPSARASPLALNKQTRDTEKEAAGMEEYSNINGLYWLQLILYRHAFPTQAATLSCSTSSRRPPRAPPAARSPAAPGMHPGRTYACRSAPVPAAAPPRLLRKPRVYPRLKLPPAHVEPASHRAEVPIPVALASRSERPDRLPAREASSAHGHVSGGKRQGLEAGWLYEESPMWRLRATSRPAPHPGSEDLVLRQHQLDPVDQLRRG